MKKVWGHYWRQAPKLTAGPEKDFLQNLFCALNINNIRYAVMRNYSTLPESTGGSDLDILVAKADTQRALTLLRETIKKSGGVSLGCAESFGFYKTYVLGKSEGGSWWGLCIDINFGLSFKGQQILSEREELWWESYKGICVLNERMAGVLGILKEGLNNYKTSQRYLPSARKAAMEDWPIISAILNPMGVAVLVKLRELILSDLNERESKRKWRKLRYAFFLHSFLKHPYTFLVNFLQYEIYKIRRYIKPSGLIMAVLGVDGSGKSTIIDTIKPILNAVTHNAVYVYHLRPSLLPPLVRLKGKKAVTGGPVVNPHASKPSGLFGSLIRLTYYTLDYILGYWLKIRPIVAKQPAIVIYDRYAYDMVLDPRRFRIGLSGRVVGWFTALVPKPDLILCLHASAETISARKQELSIEEIRRQVNALKTFAAHERRAMLLSNERKSVTDLIAEILEKLYEFLMNRKQSC